jgi:hypothetical protein
MKKIYKNHHQPFLFKHGNDLGIITSKFLNKTYSIPYGGSVVHENCWQLFHIDPFTDIETVIRTPKSFNIDDIANDVVAECNGYIYKTNEFRMSYVVSLYNKIPRTPLRLYLVDSSYDLNTKVVSNPIIIPINFHRTVFKHSGNIIKIYDDNLYVNDEAKIDLTKEFTEIVRVIGVWNNPDQYLVTGSSNGSFKSIIYDKQMNDYRRLNLGNLTNIYKSSLLYSENGTTVAWTDKVFRNVNEADYYLNVEEFITIG